MMRFLLALAQPFEAQHLHARSFLWRRGMYLMLAFDAWLVMVEHGGRYGAGNFNVAHFAWLDALLPLPTPSLYIGLVLSAGLFALTMAFAAEVSRLQKLSLFFVYTASWIISLHDSYQHHYLLSWLLLWSAFSYEPRLDELVTQTRALSRGPSVGLSLSAYTCAIVYVFTAISKSSSDWRSGAVLSRLVRGQKDQALLRGCTWLSEFTGLSLTEIFAALSLGLVGLQLVVAAGYAAVPGRDTSPSVGRRVLCSLALLFALSFHLGAEVSGVLHIGWFSYYMVWCALTLLGPAWLLGALSSGLVRITRPCAAFFVARDHARLAKLLWVGLGLMLAALCGFLDLPGTLFACATLALFVALVTGRRGVAPRTRAAVVLSASLVAATALLVAVSVAPVRFNMYRRWAGELERLGEPERALELYRKAEHYAPQGHSRAARIEALERRLRQAP